MGTRFHTLCTLASIALAPALGGCFSTSPPAQTIDISDDNAFQPVLRGSVALTRRDGAPSEARTGHAVEFGGTRATGGSDQSLRAGNYVSIGGSTFNGPATLANEFELRQFEILYRFRAIDRESGLGVDLLAGPAVHQLDVAVKSAASRASEDLTSGGPQLGLGVLWRIGRWTSVHLRGFYFFSGDDVGVTKASRVEAYLSQALGGYLAVRAGYSSWSLKSDRGGAQSPISVEFRGPVLGLEVMF